MRITNEKESVGHVSNETDPTLGRPCNLAKEHEGNVDPPIGVEEWVFSDSKNSLDTDNVFDAAFEDEEIMDIWVKAKHKKKNLVSDELHVENEVTFKIYRDLGSYDSDSEGKLVCKKSHHMYFDPTDPVPRFQLGTMFHGPKEFKEALAKPFVGLDGYFLEGKFKGEILTAVGRDGNDQIYTVAWVVVEVENRETWNWFLRNIILDLHLGDGDEFTLITDQQKNKFLNCCQELSIECARGTLYANWKKENSGGDLKQEFWAACKSTTEANFEQHICKIEQLKATVKKSLLKTDPKQWSKSYFSTQSDCGATDNNFAEAFNFAIIGVRSMAIISLLEEIRQYDEKASTSSPVVSASSTPSIILGPTTHVATEAITQAHETTPQAQLH
ncbi:hypothetical protein V6N13_034362 [Hibiscus sabdariffa]